MNDFFYQIRGKEKIREIMDEGLTSQALLRSGASRSTLLRRLPKLILILSGIVGALLWMNR